MTLQLRHARWLYPGDGRVLEDAWLRVDGPRITDLGPEPCPWPGADEEIDARGKIVLPGLVNTHHHFFQSLTRAVPRADRSTILDWLLALYPVWAGLDAEAMRAATRVAAAELLLTGCTTSADFAYLFPADAGDDRDLLDAEIEAADELGLRLHLIRGSTPRLEADLADRLRVEFSVDPAPLVEDPRRAFDGMRAALAERHDPGPCAMRRIGIGPTAVPYDDPALLRAYAALSEETDAALHTHLHPRADEVAVCRERYDRRPLEVLADQGWLTQRTWFAHGTQLQDSDVALLASTGAGLAHCPRCSMRLGFPIAPVTHLRAAGAPVGIGVDGGASNDSGSMLGELRSALVLHRVAGRDGAVPPDAWLGPADVLAMATRDGARLLRRDDLGALAPGLAADVAVFDLSSVAYAGALLDPLGGLLLAGADTRVDTLLVNGRVVVANGRLLTADERRIVEEGQAASERLIARAAKITGVDYRHHRYAATRPGGAGGVPPAHEGGRHAGRDQAAAGP